MWTHFEFFLIFIQTFLNDVNSLAESNVNLNFKIKSNHSNLNFKINSIALKLNFQLGELGVVLNIACQKFCVRKGLHVVTVQYCDYHPRVHFAWKNSLSGCFWHAILCILNKLHKLNQSKSFIFIFEMPKCDNRFTKVLKNKLFVFSSSIFILIRILRYPTVIVSDISPYVWNKRTTWWENENQSAKHLFEFYCYWILIEFNDKTYGSPKLTTPINRFLNTNGPPESP